MSAGFMGVARVRRRRVEEGREGDIECLCNLLGILAMESLKSEGTYESTSEGSPYFE